MAGLHAGVAAVDFTPKPGLPLMGNYRDDYAARGVHDPLYAKSIVFADSNGRKAARLVLDLCMLDRASVAKMRRYIGSQCDIPPEHVMITATHTHSGPFPYNRPRYGIELEPYRSDMEAFLTKAASAVVLANKDLQTVELSVGYAHEDRLSFNRRLSCKDGSTRMNWEAGFPDFDPARIVGAWGSIDPQVACLVVERDGEPIAVTVNFGLHPAILAGDNWLYSADYPGYLAEAMRRMMGDELHCLFFNGCCGNVNHLDYRDRFQGRGYKMAQRVGYMLAVAAYEAIRARVPVLGDRLEVSSERVTLRRAAVSEQQRSWAKQVLEKAREAPPEGQVDGVPDAYYADLYLRMYEQQDDPDEAEVMTIRVGDMALVGLPGETFCESGVQIKQHSPATHTMVSGLSNDALGYLPTRESFEQGGYEVSTGTTFYEQGSAERLSAAATAMLNQLFGSSSP